MRATEKTTAALIAAFCVWFLVMGLFSNFEGHQNNRILMVELGSDAASLQLAVQTDGKNDSPGVSHNKDVVIRNTHFDFVLIALYWAMFLALCYLAGRLGKPLPALFGGVCITGAAIADLMENQAILVAMRVRDFTDAVAVDIAEFSQTKWTLFFAATLLLGVAVAGNRRTSQVRRIAGWLFVGSGAFGLLGIARYRVTLDFSLWMIDIGNLLLAAGLLVTLWKLVQSVKELDHRAHNAGSHA